MPLGQTLSLILIGDKMAVLGISIAIPFSRRNSGGSGPATPYKDSLSNTYFDDLGVEYDDDIL